MKSSIIRVAGTIHKLKLKLCFQSEINTSYLPRIQFERT